MVDIAQINSSPIILGGAAFSGSGGGYGFGSIEFNEVDKIIRQAIERNVFAIDLAPIYGFGEAEKVVGQIGCSIREKLFLASKSGVAWHSTKRVNMTNCPKVTQAMLEQSLRDLKTDYIDAYFIHWPDKKIDIRKPMEVLQRKRELGQIRYIGLCNTNLKDFILASEIDKISIVQSEFNLFQFGVESDLLAQLQKEKIAFWGWGTFDKGISSGNVTKNRQFEKNDCRSWAPWWKKSNKDQKIELMQKIFSELPHGKNDGVALALAHSRFSSLKMNPIVGVKSFAQFENVLEHIDNLAQFKPFYVKVMEKYFNE